MQVIDDEIVDVPPSLARMGNEMRMLLVKRVMPVRHLVGITRGPREPG